MARMANRRVTRRKTTQKQQNQRRLSSMYLAKQAGPDDTAKVRRPSPIRIA